MLTFSLDCEAKPGSTSKPPVPGSQKYNASLSNLATPKTGERLPGQEIGAQDGDPAEGYVCPWAGGATSTTQPPSTSTNPSTTTKQTSTTTEQPTSFPTVYYDDSTAAGCADDGCTSCKTDFEQRCTTMESQKKVYCHCEWVYGCSRGATNLGMDSHPPKS